MYKRSYVADSRFDLTRASTLPAVDARAVFYSTTGSTMPLQSWLHIGSYSIYLLGITALAFMVFAVGPKSSLNRRFSAFAFSGSFYAASALILYICLWFRISDPEFWLECSIFGIGLMSPLILLFSISCIAPHLRIPRYAGYIGILLSLITAFPLFGGSIVRYPIIDSSGLVMYELTEPGHWLSLIVVLYYAWAFCLVWMHRSKPGAPYLALSILILLTGFVLGGVLRPWIASPVLPISVTMSVGILGYVTITQKLFNPFSELTSSLEAIIADHSLEQERTNIRLKRKTEQLQALRHVSIELGSRLDTEEILRSITKRTGELLRGTGGGFYLYHPKYDHLKWTVSSGSNQPPAGTTLKKGEGLAGRVWETGQPIVVDDYHSWAGKSNQYDEYQWGPIAAAPIRWGQEFFGVLDVHRARGDSFVKEDIELLVSLTTYAAIALRNARTIQEEEILRGRAEALATATAVLTQTLEMKPLLENILTAAVDSIPMAEKGTILLRDQSTGELAIRAMNGYKDPAVGIMQFAPDEGYAVASIRDDRPMRINDAHDGPYVYQGSIPEIRNVKSSIVAPLNFRGEILGAISLDNSYRTHAFTESDLDLLVRLADSASIAVANARLYSEIHHRAERLALLNRIARIPLLSESLDDVFDDIYHELKTIFNPDAFSLGLTTPDEKILDFRYLIDDGIRHPPIRQHVGKGPTSLVIDRKKPLLIRSADNSDDEVIEWNLWGTMKKPQSWLGVPMLSADRLIGTMSIQSYEPNVFSEDDTILLSTIVDQIALAIEKTRYFEERNRRLMELSIINEIGRAVNEVIDWDEFLETVYKHVSRVFDTTNFYIAIVDEKKNEWVSEFHIEERERQKKGRYGMGTGLTGYIIRTRRPILFRTKKENEDFEKSNGISTVGERALSWLGVPLMAGDRIVGAMGIQSYEQSNLYDDNDVSLFGTIADQIAVALDKLRLLGDARRRADELRTINDVAGAISSVLDFDSLMEKIVDTTKDAFGYYFVSIGLVEGHTMSLLAGSTIGSSKKRLDLGVVSLPIDSEISIAVEAARSSSAVLVNDVSKDPRYLHFDALSEVRSELSIPIISKGEAIGVLDVESDQMNAFDEHSVEVMQILANQVGIAMENARLYESLRSELTERQRIEEALEEERSSLKERVLEQTTELRETNRELARAARLKDEFLASISHELRTPLNTILGMTESLQDGIYGPVTERQHTSLIRLEKSGRHLLDLINDILDVSKIESGGLDIEIHQTSLEHLCDESIGIIRPLASQKKLTIESKCKRGHLAVEADEKRVKQILVNLLGNSVKFTPENGTIGLEVEADQEHNIVSFAVWDTGIGIDSEAMNDLFKPFIQLDSRLSRAYEGTGLGLTLVHRLSALHGGSVTVESTPGEGSKFTVQLPLKHHSDDPGSFDSPGEADRPVVFIADGNAYSLHYLKRQFMQADARIIEATDGQSAMDGLLSDSFNLALIDLDLPIMDGYSILKHIRANTKLRNIPVFAMTSLLLPDTRKKTMEAGTIDCLSKPLPPEKILELISYYR